MACTARRIPKSRKLGALCLISATIAATSPVSAPAIAEDGPRVSARGGAGTARFRDPGQHGAASEHVYLCDHAADQRSVAAQLQYSSWTGRNLDYWRWNWWGPYKYNGCKDLWLGETEDDYIPAEGAQVSYRVCLGNHGHPGGKRANVIDGSCSAWASAKNH